MTIVYKSFIAESDGDRFNLFEKTEKGKRNIGYSMRFETVLKRIITLELSKQNRTLTISEYIKEYRALVERLENILENK